MDAVEFREYCLTKPKATEGTPVWRNCSCF
jgi:hypothetical protein